MLQKVRHQRGFNLIELIVAMALSSLLMLALITVFFTVKRTEALHHELIEILDNGRYAVYLLRKEHKNKQIQFDIKKRGLYQRERGGRRQLVAYGIYRLQLDTSQARFWIRSSDKRIQQEWVFAL